MEFYWSGLPFPSPGDLPNPGIEPRFPTLQVDFLLSEPPGGNPKKNNGGGLVAMLCPTHSTPWTVACQAPLSIGFSGKNTGRSRELWKLAVTRSGLWATDVSADFGLIPATLCFPIWWGTMLSLLCTLVHLLVCHYPFIHSLVILTDLYPTFLPLSITMGCSVPQPSSSSEHPNPAHIHTL